MFKDKQPHTRIFGLIGVPLAIAVHGYTGFILAFGKGRALWNSSIMPLLFLVSAIVSGIALMILVCLIKDRFFSPSKQVNRQLIFDLGKLLLGWCLVFDIFLTGCEVVTHLVSHKESMESALLLLSGEFALSFVGIETVLGKISSVVDSFCSAFSLCSHAGGGIGAGCGGHICYAVQCGFRRRIYSSAVRIKYLNPEGRTTLDGYTVA